MDRPVRRSAWGSVREKERKRRIMLSIAAYAYEFLDQSTMSDHKFDRMCLRVNLDQSTSNKEMDAWFKKHFQPHTGMWIRKHPYKERLKELAQFILKEQQA